MQKITIQSQIENFLKCTKNINYSFRSVVQNCSTEYGTIFSANWIKNLKKNNMLIRFSFWLRKTWWPNFSFFLSFAPQIYFYRISFERLIF